MKFCWAVVVGVRVHELRVHHLRIIVSAQHGLFTVALCRLTG